MRRRVLPVAVSRLAAASLSASSARWMSSCALGAASLRKSERMAAIFAMSVEISARALTASESAARASERRRRTASVSQGVVPSRYSFRSFDSGIQAVRRSLELGAVCLDASAGRAELSAVGGAQRQVACCTARARRQRRPRASSAASSSALENVGQRVRHGLGAVGQLIDACRCFCR